MWVMEVLEFSFMQRAVVACIAICAAAPLAGTFVVQRGQSLVGDGMGHVAVAGVGAAFLLDTSPLLGAAVICVLAAATLVRAEKAGLGTDLALALVFYGGTALGYLLLLRSGVGVNRLLGVLFGSPLTLDWSQVRPEPRGGHRAHHPGVSRRACERPPTFAAHRSGRGTAGGGTEEPRGSRVSG